MVLLASASHSQLERFRDPHLGRLIQPRNATTVEPTARAGIPWAADNDAFNAGFDPAAFERMLDSVAGLAGCLFVAAPDVVGDWSATRAAFPEWAARIRKRRLPVAVVLQDGIAGPDDVPWDDVDAVFVGGTTAFKLGPVAEAVARAARDRSRWVHVGRVNSEQRVYRIAEIGAQSFDGTSFSMFRDRWLPEGLRWAREASQLEQRRARLW